MTNHLLDQLKERMAEDLESAMENQESELLSALKKATEDEEGPQAFSVSLKGTLNIEKNSVETAFSFGIKITVKDKHTIEAADQPSFDFSGN